MQGERNRCTIPRGASPQNATDVCKGGGKAAKIKPDAKKEHKNPDGAVQNLLICCLTCESHPLRPPFPFAFQWWGMATCHRSSKSPVHSWIYRLCQVLLNFKDFKEG